MTKTGTKPQIYNSSCRSIDQPEIGNPYLHHKIGLRDATSLEEGGESSLEEGGESAKHCGLASCTPQLRFPLQTRCPAQQQNPRRWLPEVICWSRNVHPQNVHPQGTSRATHDHPPNRFLRNVRMDHEPGTQVKSRFHRFPFVRFLSPLESRPSCQTDQKHMFQKSGTTPPPFNPTRQDWFHLTA